MKYIDKKNGFLLKSFVILIYTFYVWNNKSFKFLREYENDNVRKIYIHGVASLKRLQKHIENTHYDYVIGLGNYRKDAKKIRFETVFVNKYGKSKILENGEDYLESTLPTRDIENSLISDKPTTGPCNRSAYLVSDYIKAKNLSAKSGFIHIPRGMDMGKIESFFIDLLRKLN